MTPIPIGETLMLTAACGHIALTAAVPSVSIETTAAHLRHEISRHSVVDGRVQLAFVAVVLDVAPATADAILVELNRLDREHAEIVARYAAVGATVTP